MIYPAHFAYPSRFRDAKVDKASTAQRVLLAGSAPYSEVTNPTAVSCLTPDPRGSRR